MKIRGLVLHKVKKPLLGLYQNKGLCEKRRPKSGKAHCQGGLLSGKAHFPKMFLKTILWYAEGIRGTK
jgi:hypothetical protein